ncbi:CBO0543 family protein [Geobacillus subterraneus]|uniref:CBO0543 family protein n=1 Tax=Geobacillus subterraneus TaxID=129338 RepID=UPI0016176626
MEWLILWLLVAIGIGLLLLSFRFLPKREVWLSFLLNAYAASFFGAVVAGAGLLEYPVRFFAAYTANSVIFEYLLYPVVSVYVYATSRRSRGLVLVAQCAGYAAALTGLEVIFERYTDLIKYHRWTWAYSFVTMFFLTLAVRLLTKRLIGETKK